MSNGYLNGLAAAPEEVMQDGNEMVSFADELKRELDSLNANKTALLEIWHGSSAEAFSGVYSGGYAKLVLFQHTLSDKGRALKTASGILSDAERMNAMNASKIED